jgi:hypothetical protein
LFLIADNDIDHFFNTGTISPSFTRSYCACDEHIQKISACPQARLQGIGTSFLPATPISGAL